MATYNGTAGNDTKVGVATEKNSFVNFGRGRDTLTGGNLDDVFFLHVDANVDEIDGGKAGRDLVDFGRSYETHQGGLNIDLVAGEVRAQFGDQWLLTTVLRSIEDVTGSIYDDKIGGSNGDNKINGSGGNDSISGNGGNDELIGGEGDDGIDGGTGDDIISAGTDRNTVFGGPGKDTITLTFDATDLPEDLDLINGGDNIDTLTFAGAESFGVTVVLGHERFADQPGTVRSVLFTGEEIQEIFDSYLEANVSLIENVTGTGQRDFIQGNNGDNTIFGMGGNDSLAPGGGRDLVNGGAGNDFIESYGDGAPDDIFGGEGIDTVSYRDYSTSEVRSVSVRLGEDGETGTAFRRYAGPNGDIRVLEDYLYEIENITGDAGADTLIGNSADNVIEGGDGPDKISGGRGNDTLSGGNDRDYLDGGLGEDTFRFDIGQVGDLADEIGDFVSGRDRIQVTINDETPTFLGDAEFTGAGGELRIVTNADQSLVQYDIDGGGIGQFDLEIHVTGRVEFSDLLFGWGTP